MWHVQTETVIWRAALHMRMLKSRSVVDIPKAGPLRVFNSLSDA